MTENESWSLIDLLGPEFEIDRLVEALAGFSGDVIVGFHQQLATAVGAFNTAVHLEHRVFDVDDGAAGEPIPLSEDSFLDARVAVVGHGRDRWAAAVGEPAAFEGVWPLELGEDLAAAAEAAYERATAVQWPHLVLDSAIDSQTSTLPPLRRRHWCVLIADDSVEKRRATRAPIWPWRPLPGSTLAWCSPS